MESADKLERMAIVHKFLTLSEFSVKKLLGESMFEALGGKRMVELIESATDSYSEWMTLATEAGKLKVLNPNAAGIFENLALYVLADEPSLKDMRMSGSLSSAVQDLANWKWKQLAMFPISDSPVAFLKIQAIAKAAQEAVSWQNKITVRLGDEPLDDENYQAWSEYVVAINKIKNALWQEAHQEFSKIVDYWLPRLQLDDARRIVCSIEKGTVGGIHVSDSNEVIQYFVGQPGPGKYPINVTKQVFETLESEGVFFSLKSLSEPSLFGVLGGTVITYIRP